RTSSRVTRCASASPRSQSHTNATTCTANNVTTAADRTVSITVMRLPPISRKTRVWIAARVGKRLLSRQSVRPLADRSQTVLFGQLARPDGLARGFQLHRAAVIQRRHALVVFDQRRHQVARRQRQALARR